MIRTQKAERNSIKGIIEESKNQVYYDCECGKRYETFPALYLHFQRRHEQKISTKPEKESFKVAKNQTNTIITYFIKQVTSTDAIEDVFLSINENFIPKLLIKFRESIFKISEDIPREILENILEVFKTYLQRHLKNFKQGIKIKDKRIDERMFLKYLPYIYNGFISESIGKAISLKDYEHACKFILRFNTWLSNNENTEIGIKYVGFGGQLNNSSLE